MFRRTFVWIVSSLALVLGCGYYVILRYPAVVEEEVTLEGKFKVIPPAFSCADGHTVYHLDFYWPYWSRYPYVPSSRFWVERHRLYYPKHYLRYWQHYKRPPSWWSDRRQRLPWLQEEQRREERSRKFGRRSGFVEPRLPEEPKVYREKPETQEVEPVKPDEKRPAPDIRREKPSTPETKAKELTEEEKKKEAEEKKRAEEKKKEEEKRRPRREGMD